MITKIQKSIFEILFFLDRALGVSRFPDLYQTAKIRKLLKKSHRGLKIQSPITIQHPECVEIGEGVSIAAFLHIWGGGGVRIGDRVLIASHVAIVSETHDPEAHPMSESFVRAPVRIEDDVWIGAHSVIFPGVVLGRGAVVGAGSIVTRDVEPFTIVAGAPAKELRKRKNDLSI